MARTRLTQGICAALLTVVLVGKVAAEDEEPWTTDLDEAWAEVDESQRPMIVFVTSDHCPHCHRMERVTWRDSEVRQRLQDHFVALRVDAKDHPELVRQLRVQAFPTTLVVSPKRKVSGAAKGYVEPVKMRRWLASAARAEEDYAAK